MRESPAIWPVVLMVPSKLFNISQKLLLEGPHLYNGGGRSIFCYNDRVYWVVSFWVSVAHGFTGVINQAGFWENTRIPSYIYAFIKKSLKKLRVFLSEYLLWSDQIFNSPDICQLKCVHIKLFSFSKNVFFATLNENKLKKINYFCFKQLEKLITAYCISCFFPFLLNKF